MRAVAFTSSAVSPRIEVRRSPQSRRWAVDTEGNEECLVRAPTSIRSDRSKDPPFSEQMTDLVGFPDPREAPQAPTIRRRRVEAREERHGVAKIGVGYEAL